MGPVSHEESILVAIILRILSLRKLHTFLPLLLCPATHHEKSMPWTPTVPRRAETRGADVNPTAALTAVRAGVPDASQPTTGPSVLYTIE